MRLLLYVFLVTMCCFSCLCCMLAICAAFAGMLVCSILLGFATALCLWWSFVLAREIEDEEKGGEA